MEHTRSDFWSRWPVGHCKPGVGDQGFETGCVADLCDLRAVILKLERLDVGLRFQRKSRKEIAIGSLAAIIADLAKMLDAVLDTLDGAIDALAAMANTGGLMATSDFELGKGKAIDLPFPTTVLRSNLAAIFSWFFSWLMIFHTLERGKLCFNQFS
jgi:hypothetical protein